MRKKTWSEAIKKIRDLSDSAVSFETQLSVKEIEYITQENPNSYYNRSKSFLLSSTKQDCPEGEYLRIINQFGLMQISKRFAIIPLASIYEREFQESYSQRVIQLLTTDPKYISLKTKLIPYYFLASQSDKFFSKEELDKRRSHYEDKLVESGVQPNKVKSYVIEIASLAPHCVGIIGIRFMEKIKADLAKANQNTPHNATSSQNSP